MFHDRIPKGKIATLIADHSVLLNIRCATYLIYCDIPPGALQAKTNRLKGQDLLIWGSLIAIVTLLAAIWLQRMFDAQNPGRMSDVDVYKSQMRSLDKDLSRGVVSNQDYDTLRAEIGRRMIAASRTDAETPFIGGMSRITMAITAIAITLSATGIYLSVGRPNLPDAPLAERLYQADQKRLGRMDQATAEKSVPQDQAADPEDIRLAQELREILVTRPDDLRGHKLLVLQERRIQNYANAHQAQAVVLELLGDDASVGDWMLHAELQISAADSFISPQAETSLRRVLELSPNHKLARFRIGMMFLQNDRPDRTFYVWRDLLEEGPESAPYMAIIRGAILDLAAAAGVSYTPPAATGPTADQISGITDLDAADQQVMIESMVASLADRLATDGGPATDWARLITSLSVLGRSEEAMAIYQEARKTFADDPIGLKSVQSAAQEAQLPE